MLDVPRTLSLRNIRQHVRSENKAQPNIKESHHKNNYIYSFKKVLHRSLLFLCILNFKYLWNLEKWSDQAQFFKKCFLCPLLLFLLKTDSLERWNYFYSKTTFFAPKCKITIIMCSDNVFSIIVGEFINIDTKLQNLQFPPYTLMKSW